MSYKEIHVRDQYQHAVFNGSHTAMTLIATLLPVIVRIGVGVISITKSYFIKYTSLNIDHDACALEATPIHALHLTSEGDPLWDESQDDSDMSLNGEGTPP